MSTLSADNAFWLKKMNTYSDAEKLSQKLEHKSSSTCARIAYIISRPPVAPADIRDRFFSTITKLKKDQPHLDVSIPPLMKHSKIIPNPHPAHDHLVQVAPTADESLFPTILSPAASHMQPIDNTTTLYSAAAAGMVDLVSAIIESTPKPLKNSILNQVAKNKMTALMVACQKGHEECACLLINQGADISYIGPDNHTVMHYAAEKGLDAVIKLCLDACTDDSQKKGFINAATTPSEHTPLLLACGAGHSTTAHLLLEAGADSKVTTKDNVSCLHSCSRTGMTTVLQKILSSGQVNAALPTGFTPLHMACQHGHSSCARTLLHSGADATLVNTRTNQTALHIAVQFGHTEIVSLLVDHVPEAARSAFLEQRDKWAKTALTTACEANKIDCAEQLLTFGARFCNAGQELHALKNLNYFGSIALRCVTALEEQGVLAILIENLDLLSYVLKVYDQAKLYDKVGSILSKTHMESEKLDLSFVYNNPHYTSLQKQIIDIRSRFLNLSLSPEVLHQHANDSNLDTVFIHLLSGKKISITHANFKGLAKVCKTIKYTLALVDLRKWLANHPECKTWRSHLQDTGSLETNLHALRI